MRQQRRTANKKCTPRWSHQNKKQKGSSCTLDMSQVCSNCCSSIDSCTNKTPPNSNQHESSTYCNGVSAGDSCTSDDVNKMISIIYNLDFIPRLLAKYLDAVWTDTITEATDFPLCFLCKNLLKSFFLLYSQFNQLRKIESLLSRQINSLNLLINYDSQNQSQQLNHTSQGDDDDDESREASDLNSMTSDIVNPQYTTTTTTTFSSSSSNRCVFQSNDQEPCVWVEIDPLDNLAVEEIGYAPPSLRHLYQQASSTQGNSQGTTTSCHSNSTKLEFSSNDRGPWVKVGPRLEVLTVEEGDCSSLTLDLNLLQEPLQSTLEFSEVFTIPPVVQDDNDNDNDHEMDNESSPLSDLKPLDDGDVKLDDADIKLGLERDSDSEFTKTSGKYANTSTTLELITPIISPDTDADRSPLTLPNVSQEAPQSNLVVAQEFSVELQPNDDDDSDGDNDIDMAYEPSISFHGDNDENSPKSENRDVKPAAAAIELEGESSIALRAKENRRKQKTPSVYKEQSLEMEQERNSETSDEDYDRAKKKNKTRKKELKLRAYIPVVKKFSCTVVIDETGKVCPFQTNMTSSFKAHMFTDHVEEKDKNKCGECSKEFGSLKALKSHVRDMHTDEGRKAYLKHKERSKEKSKARTREENAKGFTCRHCGIDFAKKFSRTKHLRMVHEDYTGVKNTVACELCRKKFKNNSLLKRHMQTVHSDARPFSCQICGRRYKTKGQVSDHMSRSHNEEGKRKSYASNLASVQKKKLQRQEEMRKAGIDVTGNVCHHCGIDFITRKKYTMHRRTVHDDYIGTWVKVVVCEYCGKKCDGKGPLKVHIQHVHSDERPFMCDLCGLSFKSESNLCNHKRLCHTAEGRERGKLYQRENMRRKKLIREQMARKEGQEMEAETETSDSESDEESEQTRETAVVTRSSTSGSSLPLPPSPTPLVQPEAPTTDGESV